MSIASLMARPSIYVITNNDNTLRCRAFKGSRTKGEADVSIGDRLCLRADDYPESSLPGSWELISYDENQNVAIFREANRTLTVTIEGFTITRV